MRTPQIYIECVPVYVTSSCSFTALSVFCSQESLMRTIYLLCAHPFYSVDSLFIYVFECAFQCSIMNIILDRQLFHSLMTISAPCAQNVDRADLSSTGHLIVDSMYRTSTSVKPTSTEMVRCRQNHGLWTGLIMST